MRKGFAPRIQGKVNSSDKRCRITAPNRQSRAAEEDALPGARCPDIAPHHSLMKVQRPRLQVVLAWKVIVLFGLKGVLNSVGKFLRASAGFTHSVDDRVPRGMPTGR